MLAKRKRRFHFSVGREKVLTHLRPLNEVFVNNCQLMYSLSPLRMFRCYVSAIMITKIPYLHRRTVDNCYIYSFHSATAYKSQSPLIIFIRNKDFVDSILITVHQY